MVNLIKFVKSYDAFGKNVELNYDGSSTYRTVLGALMTIAVRAFIMCYAFTQTLRLLGY